MGSVRKPMYQVRSSPIHGSGLFALRLLRKETRVHEYIGERISVEEGDRRYGDDDAEYPHVLLFGVDEETVIDGGVNANEAHFINHSCDPNCEAEVVDGRVFFSTIRTIREGEELTSDYEPDYPYEVDDEARRRYACRCGAANCRGSMLAVEEESVGLQTLPDPFSSPPHLAGSAPWMHLFFFVVNRTMFLILLPPVLLFIELQQVSDSRNQRSAAMKRLEFQCARHRAHHLHVITPFVLLLFFLAACRERVDKQPPVIVDFEQVGGDHKLSYDDPSTSPPLRVALSAMLSPRETFTHYLDMVTYVAGRMGRKVEIKQRRSYRETNILLEREEVDLAFVCSIVYADLSDRGVVDLLAVPVSQGRPHYRACILANSAEDIHSVADLKGRTFAYTDPLSFSGFVYMHYRLHTLSLTADNFFSDVFFTNAHDHSIRLVDKGIVDAATVHSLIYDSFSAYFPDAVKNIRVIERSGYYGIPPFVTPVGTPDSTKSLLREIFCSMHEDPRGQAILSALGIDRFIPGSDAEYDTVREINRTVR